MAGLRQGDRDGTLEETQPRVHGEEQDQGGALHDQQELATRHVYNKEAVQATTLIFSSFEFFLKILIITDATKINYQHQQHDSHFSVKLLAPRTSSPDRTYHRFAVILTPDLVLVVVVTHQKAEYPGLDVTLVFVDHDLHDLGATINYLHEAVVWLTALVQGLVFLLIVTNPLLEVVQDLVLAEVGVVGAGSLDLLDIGLDYCVIVADGLNEEQFEALLHNYPLVKEPPPLPCCIGSV